MSFLFQNPALLGLLALAALPPLVHLLSRSRPPVYRFSNVDFLRRIMQRTARFRRPKDWLLLALRTTALLALAAAFASPFLISANSALPGEKSTVILLIDRSASMSAREGAGSRFETACAEAARFLAELRPSAANLIWIDAEPDAAFPEPGPNIDFLGELLQRAEPSAEEGALAAAFDLALRQLAKAGGRRELVVVSDFQASAWRDFSPTLPPDLTVRSHRVATGAPPNLAVTRLIPQPAEPVVGQEISVLVRVRNFSPEPVRSQLTLDADGSRSSQPLDLPAWGEAETAFVLRAASAGPMPVSAMLEADAYPGDDARHAVLRVRDSLRLAIDGADEAPERPVWQRLAAALPWIELAGDAASTRQPDLRFVARWDGSAPDELRNQALAGTTVIVHPAATCPPAAIGELLERPSTEAIASETSPAAWPVVPEEEHPANQLFRSGDFGNPFAGSFRERLRLPAALADGPAARPIARFADGVPAIVQFPTPGAPILLWNLALDPAASDWPTQGSFLPAVAEILLRTRPSGRSEPGQTPAGAALVWTSADPAHGGALTLTGPHGEALELTESSTPDGTLWQSTEPAAPGIHRWQVSGQTIDYAAVNFPDSQSDLRPLDAPPGFGERSVSADSLVRQASLARGFPLWPWLALAAVILLVAESLIHARTPRPKAA
jgi:hypothetical protein